MISLRLKIIERAIRSNARVHRMHGVRSLLLLMPKKTLSCSLTTFILLYSHYTSYQDHFRTVFGPLDLHLAMELCIQCERLKCKGLQKIAGLGLESGWTQNTNLGDFCCDTTSSQHVSPDSFQISKESDILEPRIIAISTVQDVNESRQTFINSYRMC